MLSAVSYPSSLFTRRGSPGNHAVRRHCSGRHVPRNYLATPCGRAMAAAQTRKQEVATTDPAIAPNGVTQDAVDLLERSYQQNSVQNTAVQPNARPAASASKLRPVYIRHALPVLRTIRLTERRLEADLVTVATTVMLVVGIIVWDRGVESLLDGLLGDSPLGSIFCILFGLGLVIGVRLTGGRVRDIFSV